MTPLLVAAFEGSRQLCEVLLEADADVDHQDAAGRSALQVRGGGMGGDELVPRYTTHIIYTDHTTHTHKKTHTHTYTRTHRRLCKWVMRAQFHCSSSGGPQWIRSTGMAGLCWGKLPNKVRGGGIEEMDDWMNQGVGGGFVEREVWVAVGGRGWMVEEEAKKRMNGGGGDKGEDEWWRRR